ncbi:MAG: hypothetical protein KGZ30_01765 [Anaplasmataceae bacterium]|nr:hypothetical protein [Anaplasmataceae bacterium]
MKKEAFYQFIILIFVVIIVFWLSISITKNQDLLNNVTRHGYWGLFFISVISGFNFIVPIPAASFIPLFLEAGLDFPWLILIASLGMTIADLIGYFIGHAGRAALRPTNLLPSFARSDYWNGRGNVWISGIVFLFASFIPLPNELLLIPLALLGYRLLAIIPALILGNITFNLIASWGFVQLFSIIA